MFKLHAEALSTRGSQKNAEKSRDGLKNAEKFRDGPKMGPKENRGHSNNRYKTHMSVRIFNRYKVFLWFWASGRRGVQQGGG